jgi:hypothetical protein
MSGLLAIESQSAIVVSWVPSLRHGKYIPAKVLFDREGGDAAAAVATVNYMLTAIAKVNKGETMDGQPYILYNAWTRRYEFMHIELSYSQSHSQGWKVENTEKAEQYGGDDADGHDGRDGGNGGRPAKKLKVADEETETPEAAVDDKVDKNKKKLQKQKAVETDPVKLALVQKRKETDGKLAKCKALKIRCDGAQSQFVEVTRAAEAQPEWSWCDHSQLKNLQGAKKRLDCYKSGSVFWSAWAVQSGFHLVAKKNFSAEELDLELSKMPDVERLIQGLEDEVGMVTRMATARHVQARPTTPRGKKV